MQWYDFPPKYIRQIKEKACKEIETAKQQSAQLINDINREKYSKPQIGHAIGTGAVIGIDVGFFVCIGSCSVKHGMGFSFNDASTIGLVIYMLFFLIALLIGVYVDISAKASYNSNEFRIKERITSEKESLKRQIDDIQNNSENAITNYSNWFELTAQKISVNFAESTLAKEVIDWMTSGFFRTIDAADRRAHVERINVPFMFNIYREKITCNLGTYDFELKRCAFLKNPLEQTALARAIASAMQLNTVMHYPQDVNGGEISIQIEYKYSEDHITATITYLAPNGGFKNVTQWV